MADNSNTPKDSNKCPLVRIVSVFGLTESAIGGHLTGFKRRFAELKLEIRAAFPEYRVKLYAHGNVATKHEELLEDAVQWLGQKLGRHAFSDTGESMQQVVGMLLSQNKVTLALAESCTGGLIAHLLTDVPGSSDYFLFSAVTYANQAKMNVLNVNPKTLENYGAVSEQTAAEMARGVKNLAGATYGLATSGIAGPGGGTDDKPVGTVCIGLACGASAVGQRLYLPQKNRRMNKHIFAVSALNLLRQVLLGA